MTTIRGRKPIQIEANEIATQPLPEIKVTAERLEGAVEQKSNNSVVNSLVQLNKDNHKLFNDTLNKAYTLQDALAELKYQNGKLEAQNDHLAGMNDLLQSTVDGLKLEIAELEAELEEEEEEEEGTEQEQAVNGLTKAMEQFNMIKGMFGNTPSNKDTVNAPPTTNSDEGTILPTEYFGTSGNRAILSLYAEWFKNDPDSWTAFTKLVKMCIDDRAKYDMAKSML